MKLVNGKIPKGTVCPYRNDCGDSKFVVCNGRGCPFMFKGDVHDRDFSCATSRLAELVKRSEALDRR